MLKHPLGASTLPTNKALNYLPGFHIAGFAGMLLGMLVGDENHFIIKSPLDVPLIVRAIKELRPHRIIMVPPLLMAIARLGLAGSEGFRDSVGHVYCAAAPLGTEQQREAHEALGIHVGQLWGMSETTGAATATSCIEPFRPGSGGRVMPGFELRLVDEGGKDVKHGDRGEVRRLTLPQAAGKQGRGTPESLQRLLTESPSDPCAKWRQYDVLLSQREGDLGHDR